MSQVIYIYGVIDCNEEKVIDFPGGEITDRVYTIPYKDISGVACDYSGTVFDYETKERVARKLINHQGVIEKIMQDHNVIPIKFGTLLENCDEVRKVLKKGYFEFKEKIKELDKKIELDVVALWNDFDTLIKKIGEEDKEIRNFKKEIAKKLPGDTFQDRVKIGIMIKHVLDRKRGALQSEVLELLKDKVKINGFKKHEIMDDRMILSCSFLLDSDKEIAFDKALNEVNKCYNETVNFKCVGPLPPYSFYTYEVKKIEAELIEEAKDLLGLDGRVDESEIKKAYRKLVQKNHPDKSSNDVHSQKRFEDIREAYDLLLNFSRINQKFPKNEDSVDTYMISIFDTGHIQ